MPVRRLPAQPSLGHLKHQAKDLLRDHAAHDLSTAQRLREFHPKFARSTDAEIFASPLCLSDAQLAIAREAGFASWTRLKRHIEKPTLADRLELKHHERIEDPVFRRAVDLIDTGNVTALRTLLAEHPDLIHRHVLLEGTNYFRNPSLLEFIAENPIRHGCMPANIVEVTKTLLAAGPDTEARNTTLALVATGNIPRACGMQIPLIELLCANGADPNSVRHAAALHGEPGSLDALIRLGAKIDLPILAAQGKLDEFLRQLPASSREDRHLALALASQFGHTDIARALLDAGEDPNRFHPLGGHSHGTPLHQAAGYGNLELVRLLVERGARLDLKDVLWRATPAEWAHHENRHEVEAYLREQEHRSAHESQGPVI
jgi:hypothetical protein